MDYIVSVIYGVVQGITEFLPVSSSGHLALLPHFLGVKDPGVFFDLSMHLGTAIAVTLYFRDEILRLVMGFIAIIVTPKKGLKNPDRPFVLNMLVATIATFILVLLLKPLQDGDWARQPSVISFNLVFCGALMFIADRWGKSNFPSLKDKFSFVPSLMIGLAQALAIFPGVSRSGATLSAARALGLSRKRAGEFSFILSLPIIFGGFLIELWGHRHDTLAFDFHQIVVGLLVSFLVGLLTIHFFMKLISRIGLLPFFIYRVVFALIVYMVLS